MVRGDYPTRHLSNRSLVQNWDASRAHSLGLDQRPQRKFETRRSMHGFDSASSNLAMVSLSLAGRSHFEEARAVAQRQWSPQAIAHTPRYSALFSIVTVVASAAKAASV